ncbi:MAG: DUF1553 domain-containing protein [Acidobacteria bacterium]|nr:DUF1553 domain-containing protein [Acidobacteriota bacterium]
MKLLIISGCRQAAPIRNMIFQVSTLFAIVFQKLSRLASRKMLITHSLPRHDRRTRLLWWILAYAISQPVPVVHATADTSFNQNVQPLLAARCSTCHSEEKKTSGFSVSNLGSVISGGNKHGKAILEGQPGLSPLIKLLKGELAPRMPLGGELSAAEIAFIERWISDLRPEQTGDVKGGRWLWPFQKPLKHAPPEVKNSAWIRNPIDAFILNKLEERELSPAPAVSKRTLARRVYFDLIGMPPSPEEMKAFLEDSSPEAYEKLVNKLLEDPRYGERWARHWLDLVRYGESDGLEGDILLGNAWRYRDWVIDALNSDMPYDRFATLQLAGGDEHGTKAWYQPDVQGYIPAGFLRLAPWDLGNLAASELRQSYLDEVTTATGSIFLGLTIGCARCHDHKYDPIPTRDYYRLQAIFNSVKIPLPLNTSGIEPEEVEVPYKDKAFRKLAESKVKEYRERLENGREKRALDELEQALLQKLIAAKIAEGSKEDLSATDVRLELSRKDQKVFTLAEKENHQELTEIFDHTQEPKDKKALDDFEKLLLKKLTEAYARRLEDPLARFQALTVSAARAEAKGVDRSSKYFSKEEKERHRELTDQMEVLRRRLSRWRPLALTVTSVPGPPLGPGIPATHVLRGGDYQQPGEAVDPGFPSAVAGNSLPAVLEVDRFRQFPTRGRRMTLAKWIASPDNPLTARVMVNRIWQHHFGRGIVGTPSDFGKNGERPTHPELLDWLAVKFCDENWSIKAMHRLMLTSNTYRQAAENRAIGASNADPDNRLLWRFDRRRLEAEAIRDSLLFFSGRLNSEQGGPSVFPPLPENMADLVHASRPGGSMWEPNEKEEDARRRSIYIFQRRSLPLPMMASFDAPGFNESCERRSVTTTPLQALSMLNGSLVNEEAGFLAARVRKEAGPERSAQISRLFDIVLNRPPDSAELQRFSEFTGSLDAICRVLLNSNELFYID